MPFSRVRESFRIAACLALAGVLAGPAWSMPQTAHDAEARRVLDEMADAYAALPAYVDQGRVRVRITFGEQTHEYEHDQAITYERPNRLFMMGDGVKLVCDGESLVCQVDGLRRYRRVPAPVELVLADVQLSPLGSMMAGGPGQAVGSLVLAFLLGTNPCERILQDARQLRIEPDAPLEEGGRPLRRLFLEQKDRPGLRLWVDPETRLLVQVDQVLEPPRHDPAEAATKEPTLTVNWRSGDVRTEVTDRAVFAYAPPAGYTEVAAAKPRAERVGAAHPLIGKPSPQFRLDLLEPGGANRQVAQKDLAGKVVVLDFWATWCGPCREELPEIQQLCDRLAKGRKEQVLVVAVSQDRAPEDGSPVRALVEKTLDELGVKLLGHAVGAVAVDPDQRLGDAFGIEGLPTLVVTDREGVVRHVHVGYRAGIGEVLEGEIEGLLEGADR